MQTNKKDIVVIGNDENALMFNTVGIKGYVCIDNDIKSLVETLLKDEVKIFIVSDFFSNEIKELREIYKEVYPIFLLLSIDGNKSDEGINDLRKDVERAIGISLI